MPGGPAGPARPRLVATDLDGTLLRSDGTLSEHSRDVLVALEETGTTVVFVTARPPRWLDELADAVGGRGLVICGNGAFLYDVRERRVVEQHCFTTDDLRPLLADLRDAVPGIAFAAERGTGFALEPGFSSAHPMSQQGSEDALEALLGEPVGKLLAIHPELAHEDFLARVARVVADRAALAYSGAAGLAEITASGVTKATALARWCADHGVEARDVWAFGDMPNDLPMLAWAGHAVAVRDAHPEVLAAVDAVTLSNDDDGVAAYLEPLLG